MAILKKSRKGMKRRGMRSKRSGRRSASGLQRKSVLVRTIKTVALSAVETKHSYRCVENVQLYHNTAYLTSNIMYTQTGTGDSGFDAATSYATRLGDEILAKGVDFRFWLSNKHNRPNCQYRIIVFSYPSTTVPAVGDVFQNYNIGLGVDNNKMLAYINTDRIKVLKQLVLKSAGGDYSLETGADTREKSFYRQFYIDMGMKRIKYQTPTSGLPKFTDIAVCILAYDAYGTLLTDNIASVAWSYKLYFKDP